MPICEADPWRMQYFEGADCPPGVNVPTEDADAWEWNPEFRWIYDKIVIARNQGLDAGPHGTLPPSFPVFSEPIVNLKGMGVDTRIIHSAADYALHQTSGHMWMIMLEGRHVSTDVAVVAGEPRWWGHVTGHSAGGGTFDHWTVHADRELEIERYCGEWIARHLRGYTGMLNIETIGGRMIEMHLRFSDQWPDLYGPGWVPALVGLYTAGLNHFVVEIVALARAFADAREHRNTTMQFGDVVDEFHDDDGLADAGAAERADFAALQKRADQINHLDAGRQNLRRRGLIHEQRRGTMNRAILVGLHRALFIHGFTGDVEHAPHHAFTHGHGNRRAGVGDLVAALETFGGAHGDGAHPVVAEVLLHFEGQLGLAVSGHFIFEGQRVVNCGKLSRELDVHNGADDLNDFAFAHVLKIIVLNFSTNRHLRGGDLQKFLRDVRLAQLVVFQRQVLDDLLGVVRGVFHRHHACALLAGLRLQQNLVHLEIQTMRQQFAQHRFFVRFKIKNIRSAAGWKLLRG